MWVALYAFAEVTFELVLMWIERMFGIESSTYTVSQNILHWIITTIGLVLIGLPVIFVGKKTGFDIWEHREK